MLLFDKPPVAAVVFSGTYADLLTALRLRLG